MQVSQAFKTAMLEDGCQDGGGAYHRGNSSWISPSMRSRTLHLFQEIPKVQKFANTHRNARLTSRGENFVNAYHTVWDKHIPCDKWPQKSCFCLWPPKNKFSYSSSLHIQPQPWSGFTFASAATHTAWRPPTGALDGTLRNSGEMRRWR